MTIQTPSAAAASALADRAPARAASLNYLGPMTERPVFLLGDPPKNNLRFDSRTVRMHDARAIRGEIALEEAGFMLADVTDLAAVNARSLRQMEELVRSPSGAARVGPDDEVLVFKGHDSDARYASGVPHSAFLDPTAPDHAVPRESIEARVFAFFEA